MLDVLSGGGMQFCDAVSRRKALQIGSLGTLGLSLPQLLSARASAGISTAPRSGKPVHSTFGRAKRVILLYMWGGPAHQDTWDPKPEAPSEMRGEFQPIRTCVPGLHIGEHFPLIAQQADKFAIIRSVGQEDNNHSTGAHASLTGHKHELKQESFGARQSDFPHYGSVLSYLRPNRGGMPTFVALPEVIATTNGAITPGQGGGILGRKYDPFRINHHPDEADFSIASLRLPGDVSDRRMQSRRDLLTQLDETARLVDRSASARTLDSFYQRALGMVLSQSVRRAFDLSAVRDEERWRYGWHTFGQGVLLARRLIEAGVQLVTVYWHREQKTIDTTWDTHSLNFQELKKRLMPSADRPIAALLQDLADSGLLDETLVIWNSEFGRTPKVNGRAGRDHWGACNSVVMAGGGIPGGQVFGASDKAAAYPTSDKVTQDDIAATIYHLLGFEPETRIYDRLNRPQAVALGQPIDKLLGEECRPEPAELGAAHRAVPLVDCSEIGPVERLLMERGRRFLCCEFGFPDGEREWELSGWSEPQGSAQHRNRTVKNDAASLKYLGHFYPHFAYRVIAVRLTEPKTLSGLALRINGRPVPIPPDLSASRAPSGAGSQSLWQIPIPDAIVGSYGPSFQLELSAPGWPVTALALLGDPIRDMHLARLAEHV